MYRRQKTNSRKFSMPRHITLIVTIITTAIALLLALQLKDPDSVLMRLLFRPRTTSPLHLQSTRRAFAPQASFSSTPVANMASEATNRAANIATDSDEPIRDSEGRPLGLPEPPSEEEAMKLDLSSGSIWVKLDHLGPLVVNKDGSLSRIGNWDQMTEMEKKNTLRILSKRNQLRTSALQAAEDAAGQKEG